VSPEPAVSPVRAVVFSGGDSRGAAQAGALQVILEAGVVPDLFVGTSVGAINAAFLAADPADEVWALGTGQLCEERHRPRSAVDVALQALAVQSTARTQAELACPPPGVTVHHLVLPCVTHRWHSGFSGSAELIARWCGSRLGSDWRCSPRTFTRSAAVSCDKADIVEERRGRLGAAQQSATAVG
jgi:hypothetical protein